MPGWLRVGAEGPRGSCAGSPASVAVLGAALLAACTPQWKAVDIDGDGVDQLSDCWDNPEGPNGLSGADIHPDATDAAYDGVDADCAGNDDFDADGDGFVPDAYVGQVTLNLTLPALPGGDCWDLPGEAAGDFVALNGIHASGAEPGAADVHPGATDTFYDGIDQDCAQQAADCDATCQAHAEFDADGDGFDSLYMTRRDGTPGEDCHDIESDAFYNPAGLEPAVTNPEAVETPYDDTDQNCDHKDDFDFDEDGYPCGEPPDQDGNCPGDCDDNDPTRYPDYSIPEVWYDGIDANCDGQSDFDQDGDGEDSVEYAGTDCVDEDDTINTAAAEIWYDGVDQDCDAANDYDADGDGFTSENHPDGTGQAGTDCYDDASDPFSDLGGLGPAAVNPGASDSWYDGTDQDCDGASDYDQDGDLQDSSSYGGEDCDDRDPAVLSGIVEDCDTSVDDNCNGILDEQDATACDDWYQDGDGDSHGDGADAQCWCEAQVATGYVIAPGDDVDDCDDSNASIHPDAPELCDAANTDEDCDGAADDADTAAAGGTDWYPDLDGDEQGDATVSGTESCDQPADLISNHTDCDDGDPAIYFGAVEICDSADVDEDCDGDTDDGDISVDAASETAWYADVDQDGFGDALDMVSQCEGPSGRVADATDCDDGRATVYPGAPELCDAADLDEDCDGLTEDADADSTGKSVYYVDGDGDGQGAGAVVEWCDAPSGYATTDVDCDDTLDGVYLGGTETCGTPYDDDCDGQINEAEAVDAPLWYADTDSDGYGDVGVTQPACEQPLEYVADYTDCNDDRPDVYPGATETCNYRDDDCDGTSDENSAVDAATWYYDQDGDSYGLVTDTTLACLAPAGYVSREEDCNDTNAAVNPSAEERCSTGYDDDCDGETNEDGAIGSLTWYADTDGDGYGDVASTYLACTQPSGYVGNDDDCEDEDALAFPGATERCVTQYDDDCDGEANEDGAVGIAYYYTDADGDGYGDPADTSATPGCALISGQASNTGDCDDTNAAVSPGDEELCSTVGVDDDCDGLTDENGTSDGTSWYDDFDGDGYGDPDDTANVVVSCGVVSGHSTDNTDCDDAESGANPGETETCTTAYDDDCSGEANSIGTGDGTLFYVDIDGDAYGALTDAGTRYCATAVTGRVTDHTDCNDGNAAISPGDPERCSTTGVDDDCDGSEDENGAIDGTTYYDDDDSDGYGDADDTTNVVISCSAVSGHVTDNTDCDDAHASAHPGGTETCDTSNVDEDCDGVADDLDTGATSPTTWYRDADTDTFGTPSTTLARCDQPSGYVGNDDDCDDTNPVRRPNNPEICDASDIDEDCDSNADDDDASATGQSTWYRDFDSDTYGTGLTTQLACDQPNGYVSNDDDCNDGTPAVSPAATEACDGSSVDEDCDTFADDLDPDDTPTGRSTWYADTDGDDYGDPAATTLACVVPSGYEADSDDCDDNDPTAYPGAAELCSNRTVDNDCDDITTDVDADADDLITYYADDDTDGYGQTADTMLACTVPAGYDTDAGDCDDTDDAVFPGAEEACADIGTDNDCDNLTDDVDANAGDMGTWYTDADGDGDGDEFATGVDACIAPAGTAGTNTDCDDTDSWTYFGAPIFCDDNDNDCDLEVESEAGVVTGLDSAGDPVVINGTTAAGGTLTTWGISSSASTDYTVPSTLASINVCAGDYYVNLTVADAATPTVLTIDGLDGYLATTLWGTNGGSSILHVIATTSNHEITVDNLTLADGDGYSVSGTKRAGGAVMVSATSNPVVPNVTLTNCALVDSVIGGGAMVGYGGAIAVGYPNTSGRYGLVRLEGTTVTGNSAAYGGAVYVNRGEFEADCTGSTAGFTLNVATTGLGGAFEFESTNYGSVDVTACEMGSAGTSDDNTAFDVALSVAFASYEGVSTFYCNTVGVLNCTAP